jgi:hypothetical protein
LRCAMLAMPQIIFLYASLPRHSSSHPGQGQANISCGKCRTVMCAAACDAASEHRELNRSVAHFAASFTP